MKKYLLLTIGIIVSVNLSFAFSIRGSSICEPGVTYRYSLSGIDASKRIMWSVTNGTIIRGGFGTVTIDVKWDNNKTGGSVYATATDFAIGYQVWETTRRFNVSIFAEPNVSNLNISRSGDLSTHSTNTFTLNYNSSNDIYDKTITWTFNNAGKIITDYGKSVTRSFDRAGETTVTATLKYNLGNKTYSSSMKVNLADGSNFTPVITEIRGLGSLTAGSEGFYEVFPRYSRSTVEYEWAVNGRVSCITDVYYSYYYSTAAVYQLACTPINKLTGKRGYTSYKTIIVHDRYGYYSQSANEKYAVLNTQGALMVVEQEQNQLFSVEGTNKRIEYQLNNLLTGVTVIQGTVEVGGSIDTQALPAGLYVLVLKNGTQIETHKIAIK